MALQGKPTTWEVISPQWCQWRFFIFGILLEFLATCVPSAEAHARTCGLGFLCFY